ncbi:MAG: DHHA1 domain-containing protein [Gammaproteobacteria bacterium]|nr:DHHA1 domain-containing protein [Gammaproteobacteria bacterium]
MAFIDVFNGDADGICALHQLRLAEPVESRLVTGVKRDISLLKQVEAGGGDQVTVLDISLDKNRDDLLRLLDAGARVRYFDHHFAGEIPQHDLLDAHIDTDANACSSLLVNQYLDGKYLPWAVTAAFGDNLFVAATTAAAPLGLSTEQLEELKLLGTCINYNGYGATLDDLIFTPAALYRLISGYADPFDFIHNEAGYQQLLAGYNSDFEKAASLMPAYADDSHALYILPDEKWARRVSGIYANDLAQNFADRAHAILTEKEQGGYLVSVRAPLNNKAGADALCRQFETGGGRAAAAGINHLPAEQFDLFLDTFKKSF